VLGTVAACRGDDIATESARFGACVVTNALNRAPRHNPVGRTDVLYNDVFTRQRRRWYLGDVAECTAPAHPVSDRGLDRYRDDRVLRWATQQDDER
jgi:hypothetical protein